MHLDRQGIAALMEALAGSGNALVGTTGITLMSPGKISTERDAGDPASPASFRVPSENGVLAAAERNVRACVVRLAPSVHGEGDTKGFASLFSDLARQMGKSAYVDDGINRWTAVHRNDAARLFRLAIERGEAVGHFGWSREFAATDNSTSNAITRETLGWVPTEPILLADIRAGPYF